MFTDDEVRAMLVVIFASAVVFTVVIALIGWAVAKCFPSHAVAPLVPALLAAAVLPVDRFVRLTFVIPSLLASLAVALAGALRTTPASVVAHGPGEHRAASTASALARILFIAWTVVWGLLLAGQGRLATGALALCAAPLVARTFRADPTATPARRRWQIAAGWVAAGLAAAAYAIALVWNLPDLEGFPEIAEALRAQLVVRSTASAALLVASALLLARSGLRPRTLLRVDAALIALCFAASAGIELWERFRATARLERITEAEVVFVQPPGWSENPRPNLRPMRLYEQRDGQESVLLLPLLLRARAPDARWCKLRGVAAATEMAEKLGFKLQKPAWTRGEPCGLEGALSGLADEASARFGYFRCQGSAVAYLDVRRAGWSPLDRFVSENFRCR